MKLRLGGTLEDWKARVEAGEAQAHAFAGGFALTEVKDYTAPVERVLNVLLLGGEKFDEWAVEADRKLAAFARVNGCSAIEFACRIGLEKKIRGLGYTKHRILMRKELENEHETLSQDPRHRAAA